VLTRLCVAALPTTASSSRGFLPPKRRGARARLAELARIDATLVVFESGARVQDCLRDLAAAMGDRDAAICRELTKLHEEVRRGRLADLAQAADALETRGEFVLVIAPPAADAGVMNDTRARRPAARPLVQAASRTPSRRRPSFQDGRAARSMPARSSLRKILRGAAMTQSDEPRRPPRIAAPKRVAAFRTGLSAESRASLYLTAKGYRILARRYRTPYGEIDIVAQRRRLVAFVEVKARATRRRGPTR